MKLVTVGVGGAGGRIVDRLLDAERRLDRPCCGNNVLVFDTSQSNLDAIESVPANRRIPIGDTFPGIRQEDTGVDGDVDLAVDATKEERHEIRRALDDLEFHDADAILLLAGLGGGTATGVGAVLLDEFQSIYEKPVYAAVTLPTTVESEQRSLIAARGLKSFVELTDNVLLFDNEAWDPRIESDDDDERDPTDVSPLTPEQYRTMNDAMATRLVSLFGAGESERAALPENAIDNSDVMRTLATGGVSTIGRATRDWSDDGGGFFAWLGSMFGSGTDDEDEETTDAVRTTALVKRAVHSELTLPCDVSSAERAMFVLSGAPDTLSRRGFENGIYWLEDEAAAAEVLAGDEPRNDTSMVTATILLSNVTGVPRIDALQERAADSDPIVTSDRGEIGAEVLGEPSSSTD